MLKAFLIKGIDQTEHMKGSTKHRLAASILRSTASSNYIMQKMTGLDTKSSNFSI